MSDPLLILAGADQLSVTADKVEEISTPEVMRLSARAAGKAYEAAALLFEDPLGEEKKNIPAAIDAWLKAERAFRRANMKSLVHEAQRRVKMLRLGQGSAKPKPPPEPAPVPGRAFEDIAGRTFGGANGDLDFLFSGSASQSVTREALLRSLVARHAPVVPPPVPPPVRVREAPLGFPEITLQPFETGTMTAVAPGVFRGQRLMFPPECSAPGQLLVEDVLVAGRSQLAGPMYASLFASARLPLGTAQTGEEISIRVTNGTQVELRVLCALMGLVPE